MAGKVKTAQGEHVGTVRDLVFEPAQQLLSARFAAGQVIDAVIDAFWGNVAFAVIGTAGALRPVPLDAFMEKDGEIVLQLDVAVLRDIESLSLSRRSTLAWGTRSSCSAPRGWRSRCAASCRRAIDCV